MKKKKEKMDLVKRFMDEGLTLGEAIKRASKYYENSKLVEVELARELTRGWGAQGFE